jgi:flagellar assembly protein FliH
MSCRVLLSGASVQAVPLFGRVEAPGSEVLRGEEAQQQTSGPEVQILKARVAELEGALATEVHKAREQGFEAGQMAGVERGRADIRPALDRLTRSISDVSGLRGRIRQEAERDLVELAIAIARRVLRRELTVDPEAVHGLVKAALGKVQSREVRRVRVHPDMSAIVRRHIEAAGLAGVEVSSDGALMPGDVIVETKHGDLDASIDSQLSEIQRGFADRLRR